MAQQPKQSHATERTDIAAKDVYGLMKLRFYAKKNSCFCKVSGNRDINGCEYRSLIIIECCRIRSEESE